MYYVNKVYDLRNHVQNIRDFRKRRSIRLSSTVYMLIFAFAFHVSSFNDLRFWLEDQNGRFKHLFKKGTRLPKVDALRDIVKQIEYVDTEAILDSIVSKTAENKILRENTIRGFRVCAVDGMEVFNSKLKSCPYCLTRTVSGETEYFHKAVVCMTVGSDPHVALGMEMLKPQTDGSCKDEGEMTGVKRLLKRLNKTHYHFSDVIVADALYMNAPFINLVAEIGMYSVVRAKDSRLNIVQDALGLFKNKTATSNFVHEKKQVEVWDSDGFEMKGSGENIRFLKFVETWVSSKGRQQRREMWCITTLPMGISAETVWLIMHKRWDIENNGFRMLKTYFHADHCYVHGEGADENILALILIAFNLMELFMFRRLKNFRELVKRGGMTRKHLIDLMWDELMLYDYSMFFKTG